MFYKIILSLVFTICLFASEEELVKAYQAGDYKKSFRLANELCKISCNDLGLNLILGRSAYELGLFDNALSAYDRVLIRDESNIEARLHSALIYQKSGNLSLLKVELESLKNDNRLSKSEKEAVTSMLKSLDEREKENKGYGFYGSLSLGFGYESNPKKEYLKDTELCLGVNFCFPVKAAPKEPSYSTTTSVNVGYKDSVNSVYDYDVGINFISKHYNKPRKDDFDNLNMLNMSLDNGFLISESFKINVLFSYDYLNSKQNSYLNTYTMGVSSDFDISDILNLGLGYSISHNSYIQKIDKDNNTNQRSLYLNGRLFLDRLMTFFRISLNNEKSTRFADSTDNHDEISTNIGFIYILNQHFMLRANAAYSVSDYDRKLFSILKRKDTDYRANVGFDYKINKSNAITFTTGFAQKNSTIEMKSYKNYSTNIIYRYSF